MARHVQPVPNYTTTCLVLWLVNLLWIFIAMWAIWGLSSVLVAGVALNTLINRFAAKRRRSSA